MDKIEELIGKLDDKEWETRRAAAEALGKTGDLRAVEPLIHVLEDKDTDVRESAARALGKIADIRANEPLFFALKDEYFSVRSAALESLKEINCTDEAVINLISVIMKYYQRRLEKMVLPLSKAEKKMFLQDFFAAAKERDKIEELINKLDYKNEESRCNAAKALGESGDTRALEPLLDLLADKNPDIREIAAKGLGNIGDQRAAASLSSALKDENIRVRKEVIKALVKIGGDRAVESLTSALREKDAAIRNEVIHALGKIGTPGAIDALILALKDQAPLTRWRINQELNNMEESRVVGSLIRALEDKNHHYRRGIAKILDKKKWNPANINERAIYLIARQKWNQLPALGGDAIRPLLHVLGDKTKWIRDRAIKVLSKMTLPGAADTIIRALKNRDRFVRRGAAEVLDKIGWQPTNHNERALYLAAKDEWEKLLTIGKDALEPLISILVDKEHPFRHKAAEVLGKIGAPEAILPLAAVLEEEDEMVRERAARAIIKIEDKGAVKPLTAILKDERFGFREKAAEVLGEIGDAVAIRTLVAALKDKSSTVREKAAAALDKIGWEPANNNILSFYLLARQRWDELAALRQDAVGPLIVFLKDKESFIRGKAAAVLGEIADPKAAAPLITVLQDQYLPARLAAAKALGNIGDPKAVTALFRALKDKDYEVREAAAAAIIKIGEIGDAAPLMVTLKDKSSDTREKAVEVLDKTGWQPKNNDELALYLLAKEEWRKNPGAGKQAVEILIHALESKDEEVREKAVEALGEIGDARAVEPLITAQGIEDFDFQEKTLQALGKISGRILVDDMGLICRKCFLRYRKHRVDYLVSIEKLTYYACPKCRSDSDFFVGIKKAVLLLDHGFKETFLENGETLVVNRFQRKELFDYDEIWIKDANDYEVEKLVLKLRNDADDQRKERLPQIPVFLSPGLKLSPAKINLLKDTFQVKIKKI